MITCKVGNSIINCFDGQHDKYKLKTWSNEDRLICPDCGKPYEYCHGEIVSPYFRHKEKSLECDEIYKETETDEHIKGKTAIYKWLLSIRNECSLENIHLEYYIKETRQKPDVYFEQNGQRYAIEFQCTPIATEYLRRHELYKMAGVNDIWILGCDKYTGNKAIERYVDISFDVKLDLFRINDTNILTHKRFFKYIHIPCQLDLFYFKNGWFNIDHCITEDARNRYVCDMINAKINAEKEKLLMQKRQLPRRAVRDVVDVLNNVVIDINGECAVDMPEIKIVKKPYLSSPYDYRVDFRAFTDDRYSIFFKEDSYDVCLYTGDKYRKYKNITSGKINPLNQLQDSLFDNIVGILQESYNENVLRHKRHHENIKRMEMERSELSKEFQSTYGDLLNVEILLVNGRTRLRNKDIRFKTLKGFNISKDYFVNSFIHELNFLRRKKAKIYLFRLQKYDSYFNSMGLCGYVRVGEFERVILETFKKYGFKNVKFVDNDYFDSEEE